MHGPSIQQKYYLDFSLCWLLWDWLIKFASIANIQLWKVITNLITSSGTPTLYKLNQIWIIFGAVPSPNIFIGLCVKFSHKIIGCYESVYFQTSDLDQSIFSIMAKADPSSVWPFVYRSDFIMQSLGESILCSCFQHMQYWVILHKILSSFLCLGPSKLNSY